MTICLWSSTSFLFLLPWTRRFMRFSLPGSARYYASRAQWDFARAARAAEKVGAAWLFCASDRRLVDWRFRSRRAAGFAPVDWRGLGSFCGERCAQYPDAAFAVAARF